MTGSLSIVSLGIQIEYYLKCLKEFLYPWANIKLNPYVLLGMRYNIYENRLRSSLGDWQHDVSILPEKWQSPKALDIGKGTSFSAVFGGGLRHHLTKKIYLNAQLSWQYFFSDAIDGLQARVNENIDNEWSINFQVGVIYNLNYHRPLSIF